jgi:hypothetical protein
VQLLGFIFLILGSFTYNELAVFPVCSLHKDTKYYIVSSKKEQ